MTASLPAVLDGLDNLANALGDAAVREAVDAVRELYEAPRLQVLVVGSTGAGRASVVDALLMTPDLIPRSPLPKAPVSLSVRYGPSELVQTIDSDGTRSALQPSQLRGFLTGEGARGGRYMGVDIRAPSELLTVCDVRIEALDGERPEEAWDDVLAASDVTVLVLNAGALLSRTEKDFIRDHLAGKYGLQRVVLVLNQMDRIPEEEHASLLDLLRTFLGPFEGQPAVIETAARESHEGIDRLWQILDDLVERHEPVRASALLRALAAAVDEAVLGVARQQALVELEESDAEGVRTRLTEHDVWLQTRIQRTQHSAETMIGTVIRDRLVHEIESFAAVLRRRLPEEIVEVESVADIKRYLPGYIESVWRDFLQDRMVSVQRAVADESAAISRRIERDLRSLLEGHDVDATDAPTVSDVSAEALRAFIMPKRGKHHAAGVARYLSLHGYIMLVFDPPLALVSLAASHAVQRMFKGGIEQAEKQAIGTSAVASIREIEHELVGRVGREFADLVEQVRERIAAAYEAGVQEITATLDTSAAHSDEVRARSQLLERLSRDVIPELRSLIQTLDDRDVA